MRTGFDAWLAGALTLAFCVSAASAQDTGCPLSAWITEPPAGSAVFGRVEVVVEMTNVPAGTEIASVSLTVDDSAPAVLTAAPYRFLVDVGEENREHRFAASVHTTGGAQCDTALRTPALHIDEQFRVKLRQLYVTVTHGSRRVVDLEKSDFVVSDEGEAQSIITFEGILKELREQYVIGYYPTRVFEDGSWHDVDVRVKRRGVAVRARLGYIDF